MEVNGSPEYVRSSCEASLKRLDVQYIDLYYQHRVDTKVPIEETVSHSLALSTTWQQWLAFLSYFLFLTWNFQILCNSNLQRISEKIISL